MIKMVMLMVMNIPPERIRMTKLTKTKRNNEVLLNINTGLLYSQQNIDIEEEEICDFLFFLTLLIKEQC